MPLRKRGPQFATGDRELVSHFSGSQWPQSRSAVCSQSRDCSQPISERYNGNFLAFISSVNQPARFKKTSCLSLDFHPQHRVVIVELCHTSPWRYRVSDWARKFYFYTTEFYLFWWWKLLFSSKFFWSDFRQPINWSAMIITIREISLISLQYFSLISWPYDA